MPIPCNQPEFPPGVIGIASSFLGRYREFDVDLSKVYAPPGSLVQWGTGVNIAYNFNQAIRAMLQNPAYKWIWILGDDHVFRQNTLMCLLARKVDMVTPLCLRRSEPYETVLHTCAEDGYKLVRLKTIAKDTGLLDITAYTLGNAGTLLSRHLCETVPEPWFEVGKTHPEYGGSDLYFCEKVRAAGFKMYLDMDLTIGHLTHAAIWPVRNDSGDYVPKVIGPGMNRSPAEMMPDNAEINWKQIFNDYRKNYDKLPLENHKALYEVIAKFFPEQKQYDYKSVFTFLSELINKGDLSVLEIGGWKGDLAQKVLDSSLNNFITKWLNYEICDAAIKAGFSHKKYKTASPPVKINYKRHNVLIMSHVIEHMQFNQFKDMMDEIKKAKYPIKRIYIDAPISEYIANVNWHDYMGTHVLEVGWNEIEAELLKHGYKKYFQDGNIRWFRYE